MFLETPPPDNTDTLVSYVDSFLKRVDYNNDGYIDYAEFITYHVTSKKQNEKTKSTQV